MSNDNSGDVRQLVQAASVHGGVHFHGANAGQSPPPAQLPPDIEVFVDREAERDRLDAVLDRDGNATRTPCVVISGLSGSGKSALATQWLRGVVSRFEHGQVYFDFHAWGREVELVEVVAYCLRAIGVPGDRMPASAPEAVSELRTRTHGRKVAFLFDNVPISHELLRLGLTSTASLMVVTSHHSARSLAMDGVEPIELRALEPAPARQLLSTLCGAHRVDAEPDAAQRLVELCGGLPIALRVVAGRLARRPKWTLQRAVDELADETQRLNRLVENGEAVVRNTLDFAFDDLTVSQQRMYSLLGAVPGSSFSVRAVAAMTGSTPDVAEEQLHELHEANLVEENDQEQYRFHDLVRVHAHERAMTLGQRDREEALLRLVQWYRQFGAFADRAVMDLGRLRVSDDDELVAATPNPFDHASGLEWLERERLNIQAAVAAAAERHWNRAVISLCDSPLWSLHNQHKHYRDTTEALDLAVVAAQREQDLVAETRMRTLRVRLLMECQEFDRAHEQGRLARQVGERCGHRRVLASAIEFHGRVHLEQQRWDDAIELFWQAFTINEELGQPRGMALQEHFLGQAYGGRGEHDEALRVMRRALGRLDAHPNDRRTPARIRVSMGRAYQQIGRHDTAIEVLRVALSDMVERQVSFDMGKPLELVADSLDATGDSEAAREHREQALRIYEQSHSPEAERLRQRTP